MLSTLAMGALTGAVFGTVLYKVAAMRHSRVLGMLTLSDLKIMKFAFTAIAVASFGYGLADLTGTAESLNLVPRTMSFMGWAHVLGGVIFGAAMGLTGLCPGTAACRLPTNAGKGKLDGLLAVVGLFVGVAVYAAVKEPLVESGIIGAPKALTLHGALGLPYGPVAMLLGAFFLLLSTLLDRFGPEPVYDTPHTSFVEKVRGEWHWLVAGTLGGLTVLAATMQDGYIGFSGSILATYGWVADAIGMPSKLVPEVSDAIVWRAALIGGVVVGALFTHAWSLKQVWPSAEDNQPTRLVGTGSVLAFGGGTALALGAMIGGGCTTGAFIAAFPTLSLGSFAMGGTFFAVALVTAAALRFSGQLSQLFPKPGNAPGAPTGGAALTR
jgi:uncharacterized membrane protein YedE/YeeE